MNQSLELVSLTRKPKPNFKKENNIRYIYTHDGILLPLVPGVEGKFYNYS